MTIRSLPLVIALFSFIVCLPLGFIRFGMDVWRYYNPAIAGSPKIFHDHHGLGIALIGLVLSGIFTFWFWLIRH
jgi:hypothetical protein